MEILLVAVSFILMIGAMVALVWLLRTNRELPEPRCSASRAELLSHCVMRAEYGRLIVADDANTAPRSAECHYRPSQAARDAIATEQFMRSMRHVAANRKKVLRDK